ncbi:MAG: nuclear transport factor 2 family protein [Planctomycetota bacterium]
MSERNRALNAHDLDAFLATYADNVEIFVYPSTKIGDGKKHIEKIFSLYIEKKDVSIRVKKTLEADGYVVVESATTFGKKIESGIAIYEVRDGKIKSVRFLRDTLRAKQTAVDEGS